MTKKENAILMLCFVVILAACILLVWSEALKS